MSNHTEWGGASDALYTLHTRAAAIENLLPADQDGITAPFVLGLWNENGDGLALQGTRRQVLDYLRQVTEHVQRETDPRLELDQALKRLHGLRAERAKILETEADTGYGLAEIRRLDEQEVDLLNDVAELAEGVNEDLYPY